MFDSRVAVGAWQLVAACVLWTGHVNGVQAASKAALLASALAVLACIPVNEYLDRPKNEAAAGVVTLATLGVLNGRVRAPSSRTQRLCRSPADETRFAVRAAAQCGGPRVAAGVLSFIGLLIHLTPIETAELYQIQAEQRSPLLYVMISLMGATIFTSGLFVGALAMGLAHPRALACSLLANAVLTCNLATRDVWFQSAPPLGAHAAAPHIQPIYEHVRALLWAESRTLVQVHEPLPPPRTAPLVWSVITTGLAASALVLSR